MIDDSSDIPQKRCANPDCHQWLPATTEFFSRNKNRKSGLEPYCKRCMKAYQLEHRERIHEYKKQYYETNKAVLSKRLEQYRQTHKEQHVEYDKQRYLLHGDEMRVKSKAYQQSPKGRMVSSAAHHKRRLQKKSTGTLTAQDIANQMKRQRSKCYYCSVKLGKGKRAYHVDHIVPLTRDGSHSPENIVIACPTCNLRKHNKLLSEWPEGNRLF